MNCLDRLDEKAGVLFRTEATSDGSEEKIVYVSEPEVTSDRPEEKTGVSVRTRGDFGQG